MAYKIHYHTNRQTGASGYRLRKLFLCGCFFLFFVIAAFAFAPEQLEQLRQLIYPQSYVDALLQHLQEGQPFAEAVDAFCQELLHGR